MCCELQQLIVSLAGCVLYYAVLKMHIELDDIPAWEKEMKDNLKAQHDFAYSKFPSMIQKMKGNVAAEMNAEHWWRFKEVRYTHF